VLRLATTTTLEDSGLLERLLPPFEQQQQVRIDVIVVGSGKALQLGAAGDVDVVWVHAPEAEQAFLAAGYGVRREPVMSNRFQLLGPRSDPAEVAGLTVRDALRKIASGNFPFVSRGDASGTHQRERQLWQAAGVEPTWSGYQESGQGMGATLRIADQLSAYVLCDRGTYLRFRDQVELVPCTLAASEAGSEELENPYAVLVVNPAKRKPSPSAGAVELAQAFVDFLVSAQTQQRIAAYQIEGESLFQPLAPAQQRR
jgi:tungstate transport system substrate-binding protein